MKQKWNILTDCRKMSTDEIVDALISSRVDPELIEDFFSPTEDYLIPHEKMLNVDVAYKKVRNAIDNKWNIVIHADCDVDGCSSAAIMYRYLSHLSSKKSLNWTINTGKAHGITDNYDCSVIKDKTLLIIVDSINKSYDKIYDYAKENNLEIDVIILDHHIVPKGFDSRPTLVSSANNYPNPQLSGAGVCWKFCNYMDWEECECFSEELYDLAACGLVADMVDMTVMENRYIVNNGLGCCVNPGISEVIGNYKFDSTSISYSIAPLVNAACRMQKNHLAAQLFIEDDEYSIKEIVNELKECKELQNKAVDNVMPELMKQHSEQENKKVEVFLIDKDETGDTTGLIGNKMLEICQKPVLILHDNGNSYSGSARAVGLNSFIDYVRKQDVIFADGHENAFGLAVEKDKFEDVINGLEKALADVEFVNEKTIDILVNAEQINAELVDKMKWLSRISGEGFKPVTVCVKGIESAVSKPMSGGKHMRMIKDGVNFIKWNCKDDLSGKKFDVYGTLDKAYWGRSWQYNLIVDGIDVKGE